MKQRFVIVVFTVLVFAAGFFARMATESGPRVPAPPTAGAEFVHPSGHSSKDPRPSPFSDNDRAKLLAKIAEIRPQIDAYRDRMNGIEHDFARDFVAILTPEQRANFAAHVKKNVEKHRELAATEAANPSPLSDEQIERLRREPLFNALDAVVITWRFNYLNREYKLTPEQQVKTRAILEARRQKFLALVDTIQPPTITLSQLASQVEKLGTPAAAK